MHKYSFLYIGLVGAWLTAWPQCVEAQRGRGLTFGPSAEVPAEGVTFRVTRGAAPVGLPQPQAFIYRRADGATLERFAPRDLWFPSVFLGRWEDASGTVLIMGKLGPMPPDTGTMEHVSRDEYHTALSRSPRPVPSTWQELTMWLEFFIGVPPVGESRPIRSGPRLDTVLAYDFSALDRDGAAYLFLMSPNVHRIDPDQWFVAVIEWPQELDSDAVRRSIEQDFIGSLGTMARAEDTSGRAAARFQHAELGAQVADARSPAFLESRERAINSIRGLPGWWFVETPNYVLVSDLSGGRRSFVQRLQEELESMRTAYERIFPPRKPIDAVSLVRVFSDGADYVQYVGPEQEHTGGLWMPSRRELVVRTFEWGNELERRARIAQIVYHEAFHQYIHYAFDYLTTSPWYNEGHATFFEGADIRRGDIRVDEVDRYVQAVQALTQRGPLPVDHLLRLDYDSFYQLRGGSAEQRRANYAMAWGLIYYLRKGAPLEPENDYEQIIPRYEDALWEMRDPLQATQRAFADVDMAAFTASFTDFWGSDRRRHRARRNHDWSQSD